MGRVSRIYPIYLVANLLALAGWQSAPVTMLRWLLTLTMTNMWYPDPNLNPTFAFPAWTITTLSAFYITFPLLISILQPLSSQQLKGLIAILFFFQLLSALLFFNEGCNILNELICKHPLPRLPVFVMGAAGGLIRLRCHEEPTPSIFPSFPFLDFSRFSWKTSVDLSFLLILSVPFLPRLHLFTILANVLFVLPQLVIIMGLTCDSGSSITSFVCRMAPLQFIGQISLEIYLLHDPVFTVAFIQFHFHQDSLITLAGSGMVTLLLSFFFCHFFRFLATCIQNRGEGGKKPSRPIISV